MIFSIFLVHEFTYLLNKEIFKVFFMESKLQLAIGFSKIRLFGLILITFQIQLIFLLNYSIQIISIKISLYLFILLIL